jgi:hypothetical protein
MLPQLVQGGWQVVNVKQGFNIPVDGQDRPFCLETNSVPCCTPLLTKAAGMRSKGAAYVRNTAVEIVCGYSYLTT